MQLQNLLPIYDLCLLAINFFVFNQLSPIMIMVLLHFMLAISWRMFHHSVIIPLTIPIRILGFVMFQKTFIMDQNFHFMEIASISPPPI